MGANLKFWQIFFLSDDRRLAKFPEIIRSFLNNKLSLITFITYNYFSVPIKIQSGRSTDCMLPISVEKRPNGLSCLQWNFIIYERALNFISVFNFSFIIISQLQITFHVLHLNCVTISNSPEKLFNLHDDLQLPWLLKCDSHRHRWLIEYFFCRSNFFTPFVDSSATTGKHIGNFDRRNSDKTSNLISKTNWRRIESFSRIYK